MANKKKPDELKKKMTAISIDRKKYSKGKELGNGNFSKGVCMAIEYLHSLRFGDGVKAKLMDDVEKVIKESEIDESGLNLY